MLKKLLLITTLLGVSSVGLAGQTTGTDSVTTPATVISEQAQTVLNINTATVEQLSQLKGVGTKKAQAIVDYRNQHGPFKNITELTNVKGIGTKTLAENASHIVSKSAEK